MNTVNSYTRADEAFAAAMNAQRYGQRIKLGREGGIWTVVILADDTTDLFRANLLEGLREVRYSPCVELLNEDARAVLAMIHAARLNGLIDMTTHANLYGLLKNAKQHAYDHLAAKALHAEASA